MAMYIRLLPRLTTAAMTNTQEGAQPAPVDFDPDQPLNRVTREPLIKNTALRDYYAMGPGRSIRRLAARYKEQKAQGGKLPPTLKVNTLFKWSTVWAWQERVAAQTELDNQADKLEIDQRRRDALEAEWVNAQALRDIAGRIFAESANFIKTTRRVVRGTPRIVDQAGRVIDPGTPEQVITTLGLDLGLAIKAAQTSSQLARLSLGLVQEKTAVDVAGSVAQALEVDYTNFDDSTLRRVLEKSGQLFLALSGGPGPESDQDPGQADSAGSQG